MTKNCKGYKATPLSIRLKELRKQSKIKQEDVAKSIGVKRVTITAYIGSSYFDKEKKICSF